MDIAFLLGTKIIELTLTVLIGYGLVKSKLLQNLKIASHFLLLGFMLPVHQWWLRHFKLSTPEIPQGLQLSLLMAVFLHIILIIIGSLLKHLLKLDPIEHATSIYSNSQQQLFRLRCRYLAKNGSFTLAVLLGANLSVLDALSFDYCRKRKFILEDDC